MYNGNNNIFKPLKVVSFKSLEISPEYMWEKRWVQVSLLKVIYLASLVLGFHNAVNMRLRCIKKKKDFLCFKFKFHYKKIYHNFQLWKQKNMHFKQ